MSPKMWTVLIGLAAATFVSEDAALLGAAGLTRAGALGPVAAGLAVALGIWAGDFALFLAGRGAARWPPLGRWVGRRWRPGELAILAARLERRAAWVLLLSRAVPGTRVPLYVAAGMCRLRPRVFLVSTAVGVALWTAAFILGARWLP